MKISKLTNNSNGFVFTVKGSTNSALNQGDLVFVDSASSTVTNTPTSNSGVTGIAKSYVGGATGELTYVALSSEDLYEVKTHSLEGLDAGISNRIAAGEVVYVFLNTTTNTLAVAGVIGSPVGRIIYGDDEKSVIRFNASAIV